MFIKESYDTMQTHHRPSSLDAAFNVLDKKTFSQLLLFKIPKYILLNIVCKLSATSKEIKRSFLVV